MTLYILTAPFHSTPEDVHKEGLVCLLAFSHLIDYSRTQSSDPNEGANSEIGVWSFASTGFAVEKRHPNKGVAVALQVRP